MSDLWKQIPADSLAVLDSYMTDHYLPEIAPTAGVVMTSGDQSVGGVKTFTSNTNFQGTVSLANNVWNKVGDDVALGDHNISGALCIKGFNDFTGLSFVSQDESSNNKIYYDTNDDNSLKITHPSAAWGSLVTTAAWSKSANGYYYFGNQFLVNYGVTSINENRDVTVTLPHPYTNTNYAAVANYKVHHTAGDAEGCMTVDNFTKTTFRISAGYINPNSGNVNWIVIGYYQ